MNWYADTTRDGIYDTEISLIKNHLSTTGANNALHQKESVAVEEHGSLEAALEALARSLAASENWTIGAASAGAKINTKFLSGHDPENADTDPFESGVESLDTSDFFYKEGDFIKEGGEVGGLKHEDDLLALIKPHKPHLSDQAILAQIRETMPKLQGVSEEDKGFAKEGFQKDVYGVSKEADKASTQVQQAYGSGMGSSMRSAFGAQKDVTQKFKQAEQGYAEDIYGLEQKKEGEFESDVTAWLGGFRQGGRVPLNKRQTFSQVLSRIPDAGGN